MKQLTPVELKRWLADSKDFLLVDVREEHEREHYNIGGIHIPMGELMSRLDELPKDKVKEYDYPVCFNFPAGHQDINYTLTLGMPHKLIVNDTCGTLELKR